MDRLGAGDRLPDPGPVLANYGLDALRFLNPPQPGESIKVRLTAMEKAPGNDRYGEVRRDVEVQTSEGEVAADPQCLRVGVTGFEPAIS